MAADTGEKTLLVMGVGNILLMDDGLGVWAVQELEKERDQWPENISFLDCGTFTQDIYHLFEGYDGLLVLDVVHMEGQKPGAIHVFEEKDIIQNETQRLSIHDVDMIDSLRMAEMIGKRPKMRVLGMQPECFTEWDMKMTDSVQAAFPAFVEAARAEIRRFLDGDF